MDLMNLDYGTDYVVFEGLGVAYDAHDPDVDWIELGTADTAAKANQQTNQQENGNSRKIKVPLIKIQPNREKPALLPW